MKEDSLSDYLEEIEREAKNNSISKNNYPKEILNNYNNIDSDLLKYDEALVESMSWRKRKNDFWYSEKTESTILNIEDFRPAIKELVKVDVITEVYENRKIKVQLQSGVTQLKVIVHGSQLVTIQYLGERCYKGINKIEIRKPFSSFVIIDDDIKDINSKLIIEDVFYKVIDCRSIMLSTTTRTEVCNWEYKC